LTTPSSQPASPLCPRLSKALLALVLAGVPSLAHATAVFDVQGSVVSTAPRLAVRVVVTNRGDRAASPLDVVGELLGERSEASIPTVVPGASGSVVLDFAVPVARPGVHALTLLLEHPVEGAPDAAGSPPVDSRRAWLLLALGGANSDPAVRLHPSALRLDVRGALPVRVESADDRPHLVHLRALTARGLRAEGEGMDVAVPDAGFVSAALPLMRAGPARESRHAVLVVAEATDGPVARTTVATATVDVVPTPGLVPRLHVPLLALGVLLLAVALAFEVYRWRRRPAHDGS